MIQIMHILLGTQEKFIWSHSFLIIIINIEYYVFASPSVIIKFKSNDGLYIFNSYYLTTYYCSKFTPNKPHILNKYQINLGFSHFHGIWNKNICTVSNRCCEVIWFSCRLFSFIWYWIFLPTNDDFGRWKEHLFGILFFAHYKNCVLKNLVALPINTTFNLKFSCSTGDEWNFLYNEK